MASGGAAAGAAALDVDRVRAALWGMHIGDALAMPVHWYYNLDQLKRDFGSITKYEAPKEKLPGSIMSLSSTGGGGRGSDAGTIVGDVILHGKRKYWARGGDYHYHRGMAPGENTLEVTVTRECFMASLSDSGMEFNREDVRDRYIRLMTTPDSHNDTYAGTCHRMFFANRENGKPLDDCPDNDQHNVDTIDGLVNLPPVIFAAAAAAGEAQVNATAAAAVTLLRRSSVLPQYAQVYAAMLMGVASGADLKETVSAAAASVGLDIERAARGRAPMVACYLPSSFPALMYFAYKYDRMEEGLLASTNAGGENVARGATLGALYGAAGGMAAIPAHLKTGLHNHDAIETEIERYIKGLEAALQKAEL